MIKNILKHSLRALKKQRGYVAINIFGLSIGIASSLIIALFIIHQLSFDQFNLKKDRIYRLTLDGKIGEQEVNAAYTASVIGPTMATDFPEVEKFCRLNIFGETIVKKEDLIFSVKDFVEVDSSFFEIFSIPLLKGNIQTVLTEPNTMVLSESMAKTIFGSEDPIDKMLQINTRKEPYRITGVMANFPEETHFNADILTSFVTNRRANDPEWLNNSFSTYVLLKPNTSPKNVEAKFPGMVEKYIGPRVQQLFGVSLSDFLSQGNRYNFHLQPLTSIHHDPTVEHEVKPAIDPKYLIIFGSIAILIIVIASINFMNLSTAQATKRAKEIGVKKVSGSSKSMLVLQFLTDSVVISFIALIIAVIMVFIALPFFNNLLDAHFRFNLFSHFYKIPVLFLFAFVVGILAGAYPAFYLSSFNPSTVLKGKVKDGVKNGKLRSILVSVQFLISIVLIIGTIIMYRQLTYMVNKDLGFGKDRLLVIEQAGSIGDQVNTFKQEVLKLPGIRNVSASTAVPGHNNNNNGYMLEGRDGQTFLMQTAYVDYDFLDTYGMQLTDGRFFDRSYGSDKEACIVNQKTIEEFGIDDFQQTRFVVIFNDSGEKTYMPIIGVCNDFHFESLHNRINPYIMRFKQEGNNWGYITVKFNSDASVNSVKQIEDIWKRFASNNPLQYFFMNDDFSHMYKAERQNAELSVVFAILGIFIAALGLFGLTSFTIEQRTKEVGVRKALGASGISIFYLISKEIIVLVCIATAVAWPLIYWVASNWLHNYYYRINLRVFEFVIGFALAIAIALTTISYKTLKSIQINPANTLRYE
ncbi:FtsX-like permease family protein [Maribellus comscasis]|uniref:FtsX-like permease family protein n=1 Tax=Maribellus comscasis TaxID=2681766 RepID=A0A6I6K2C6_9BACT|nr:ABC transporter permease [Maribellus comscasis]QGY46657.1 FtsX-like permease family protein [Maribellus comscasis]